MRLSRSLSKALIGTLISSMFVMAAAAQDQAPYPPPPPANQTQPYPPPPPPPPPPPANQVQPAPPPTVAREWVPEGVAALGQNATSRTEFTLDHSMLVLAAKLDKDNEDLRRVIAGVNGVSVHSFRFPVAVSFDPAVMDSIRQQYRAAGWQHLVDNKKSGNGLATDLWIHMDHASIQDIAVLFVGMKQLNFVSVSGSITPLDLLHLSGHFGIPKMDGGAIVPAPQR